MQLRWKLHQVADLIAERKLVVGDGYRAKNVELTPEGLPFARAGNIDGGFQFDDADHFPEDNLLQVGNKVSQAGDVVFTSKGTVGRFAFVGDEALRFVYSPQLCFWRSLDPETLHPRFLYYWMLGPEFFQQYKGVAGQTDMAEYVSLSDQRRMHITLPPLSEQRAIAQMLGALDDKIELNRRMNETLESIAQAIFKSWFVDFDPVRAKLDGRPPTDFGVTSTITLFPSHFDHDDALGLVPKGWHRKCWGDIATLEYGKSLRDYRESSGKYRVFGTNGPIGFTNEALCNGAGIVIGRKGAYRGVHYSQEPFFVIDTAFYLQPTLPLDLKWAYYELLRFDINSMDSGSAIPSTSRGDFYGIPVILPPPEIQSAFGAIVSAWFAKIFANEAQSRTLATLRDALLPKLLSGELSVDS
jgi:type I restriction enzyme, S subunit